MVDPPSRRGGTSRDRLLLRPDFRRFFLGQGVSLFGSALAPVALAFAVLDATDGDTTDLGVVLAAHMIPLLAFLLVGGAVADRFARRTVLVWANLGSGLTQGAVAFILLTHSFSLIAVTVLELLNGVLAAFTTPALRGFVPELVEKHQIQRANALLGSVRNAAKILGPSLSGILVVAVGGGPAIAVDAATYLFAALCLGRLSRSGARPEALSSSAVFRDIRAGWHVFASIRWVWIVSAVFCAMNLVNTGTWQILAPELTLRLSNAATWGFVLSARGVGMLLMSTLMVRIRARHLLALGQAMSALSAIPLLALGARLPAPWLIAAAFVAGLGSAAAQITWDTSLQEHVPPHALSRVASFDDLLSYVAIPLGQLSVGPLATAFGGFRVVAGAGAMYAFIALLPLAFQPVRRLTRAQPAAADPAAEDPLAEDPAATATTQRP